MYSFEIDTFIYSFINCFNPFAKIRAITAGARVEILTAFLASFYISFFIFKRGIIRSLFLSISIYTVILFYGYLPALYKMIGIDFYSLSEKSATEITSAQKFLFMYLVPFLLISASTICALYKENKENLKTIASFLYPSRLLFYILILIFGFLFTSQQSRLYPAILNLEDLMKLVSAVNSIVILFLYAKIINDIHDLGIDRISNKNRAIAKNAVSVESAEQIKNILLIISFVFALAAEISFIFYWLFIWAISYVYSVPPLRIRRYYPLGHLSLSFIGTSLFLAGGALVKSYDTYKALEYKELLLFIFSAFFFISNVKDFKDIEGDKAARVHNILNYIHYPKPLGIIFISGFTLSMCFIAKILNIMNTNTIVSILLFFMGSTFYIIKIKNIGQMDKLLLFSLIFSVYITGIWIYKITTTL